MSKLTELEREARQVREFITELNGLTPRFNVTKERAEEELKLHLDKITSERERLAELIDVATDIVHRLGAVQDVPSVEAAMDEAMANDFAGVIEDDLDGDLDGNLGGEDYFIPIGDLAADITAALADIADEAPVTPDASDEPEMTDMQVDRVERYLAEKPEAEALEPELAESGMNRAFA